jgi:hypothetical protein
MSLDKGLQSYFEDVVSSVKTETIRFSAAPFPELLSFFNVHKSPLNGINWKNCSAIKVNPSYKEKSVDNDDLSLLFKVYTTMFPEKSILIDHLSRTISKYSTIEIFNQQFGSKLAHRSKRSTGIIAGWPQLDGEISDSCNTMSFGLVEFYFSHSLKLNDEFTTFYFACVTWYRPITDTSFNVNPLLVASIHDKIPIGPSGFMPVQRISTKCAVTVKKNEHSTKRYIFHLYHNILYLSHSYRLITLTRHRLLLLLSCMVVQ